MLRPLLAHAFTHTPLKTTRPLAAMVLVLMLAACGTPSGGTPSGGTPSGGTPEGAPGEGTEAPQTSTPQPTPDALQIPEPMPEAKLAPIPEPIPAPEPVEILPDPLPDPHSLIGLSQSAIANRLGQPKSQRRDPPALLWQYIHTTCFLDVFLYQDTKDGPFSVDHAALRGRDETQTPPLRCLWDLMQAHKKTP